MYRRIAASAVLVWMLGFLWFAVALPSPAGEARTDAIIVLTGGAGRIDHGLDLLRRKEAPSLLVSGVDPEVREAEFRAEYDVSASLMQCCVTLGRDAYDTRSNAVEAGDWVRAKQAKSVRLVTSDWHMRRASLEIARELPEGVKLVTDAVTTRPSLGILFLEYHKWLARLVSGFWFDA
ncbi:hypothetical protein B2G71_04260 [Novosphingobium sp. PC22D]|uniref:YdcF family protein n=1 Tax=Novosphingobium sp. PC22D TaxID=1962403 RepID=UPI000BF0A7CA|nr:YdcF family protein [Novosphingobium sp. PC22D]PEQ13560.1 hypothetical protein B2G71_04260 [Novosphingobium sp. PC22D]